MTKHDDLPAGISQSTINHFSQIPLAQSTLQDPAFRPFPSSRQVDSSGRGHTLTGKTWNTPDTIRDLLSLHRASTAPADTPLPQAEDVRSEVRRFYTFGSDMNAHPDLLHGGVIATILDSTLGHAVGLTLGGEGSDRSFTAQLNVSFTAPVRTPGTVRVRAWIVRVEADGRKISAEGFVESNEGGKTVVNARGEGMWVKAKAKRKKGAGKL